MKKVRFKTPANKQWVRAISDIPPNGKTMYDYRPDRSFGAEGWLQTGRAYLAEPGKIILACRRGKKYVEGYLIMPAEFGKDPLYELKGSPWSGPQWAHLARHYLRSWLALNPVARVARAVQELERMCKEPLRSRLRVMRLELIGEFAGESAEDVLNAFRAWVEEVSNNVGLSGPEVLDILERGLLQRANDLVPTPQQLHFELDDEDDIRPIDLGSTDDNT